MDVLKAFGLVALGMLINQFYNWVAWKKFYEGRKEGLKQHGQNENLARGSRK